MEHAITQLEISLEIAENNAPINEAEGNFEQAALERECADSYRDAIKVLEAVNGLTLYGIRS